MRSKIVVLAALAVILVPSSATAATGQTVLASVASSGGAGNNHSTTSSLSGDGRLVVFRSLASNLVPGDTNNADDIFVRDVTSNTIERVSVSSAGVQGNAGSRDPVISSDGRFVAFNSSASNLVAGDTNNTEDIFVHDRETGTTSRVSVSSTGAQGNFQSFSPSLSRDGRFVAFRSSATTLVTGKATGWVYIFRHDLQTGETIRVETDLSTVPTAGYTPALSEDGSVVAFATVAPLAPADTNGILDVYAFDFDSGQATLASVATSGSGGNGISGHASAFTGVLGISGNGRIVAFPSEATDLVSGDTNGIRDTFVRDLDAEATERVSVSSSGAQGDATGAQNWVPATSLSRSGRYVGFVSRSSNLVEGDTNGTRDVFRRDRLSGQTDRVSLTDAGAQAAGENTDVWLSADGSRIAFTSFAKLVDQDTNGALDVYVRYSSTCPSGSDDGVVTGIVHEQVEPLAGDSAPTVHEIGCAINATTGL